MMLTLPPQYADLVAFAPALPILAEALKLYGTAEVEGQADNPVILEWAKDIGGSAASIYTHDEQPWCGLFMGIVAKRAGYTPPFMCIRAFAWREFGTAVTDPCLGDILVFVRAGGGHVGIYVGEDPMTFHILGGNQGDCVKIARVPRMALAATQGIRRPLYASTPGCVRPIIRTPVGPSTTPMV